MRFLIVLLVACGAGSHGGTSSRSKKDGAIAGLVRDRTSGESIALAEIEVGGRKTESNKGGMYDIDLRPGTYDLHAEYAGQHVTVKGIEVVAGMASYADVPFTLGEVTPLEITWGDGSESEIQRFTTKAPRIEGTVGDASTRGRVAGAVVTAARGVDDETLQTITDDNGRYRFDNVDPGTYAISAYYSIGGRAQIEVRRSDITVKTGEGVLVPLWIELAKQ